MTSSPIRIKAFLPLLLIVGLVSFFLFGGQQFFSFTTLALHYGDLKAFVAQHYGLAAGLFCLVYVASVALSLPIALLLTLAGGALLGWAAIVLIILSATAGASILFIAARTLLSAFLLKRIGKFLSALEDGFRKDSFSYLLALRLIPVAPFWVVNIVPAFVGMALGPFALATGIGIIPGTVVYVSLARGFDIVLARGEVPDLATLTQWSVVGPLIALGVLALIPPVWRRLQVRRKNT